MTVIGLMHIAWFTSNLVSALAAGVTQQMFQEVWTYADMSFGFGGLIIGISMIAKAGWARTADPVFARGLFQPSLVQRLLRPRSAAPDVGRYRPHLAAGRGGGLSAAGPLAVARGEAVISQTTYQRNVG
jgi:hypothetical protein